MIPYGRQSITDADIEAVEAVLRGDWLTQGPAVGAFENAIGQICNVDHAVSFANASIALVVACKALDLREGDYLWTTPNTFVASSNCALHCGANVDFVDIDPITYNLSVDALRYKLEQAERNGKLPKIVVPVHFSGASCEMEEIRALSKKYGFSVIEDASHAIGGKYKDFPVGSCEFSDITIFSFHPVKIMTTGEGGIATTKDPILARKMKRLSSHGITREAVDLSCESHGQWYYEQLELGFNARMTDIQAALGVSQSKRIRQFVERRGVLATRYDGLLSALPLKTPTVLNHVKSSWHLYVVRIDAETCGRDRRDVFDSMRDQGVLVNVHYIPVHLQPLYKRLGFAEGDFPEAEKYYWQAMSIPLYFDLTEQQQDRVVNALAKAIRK